LDDDDNIEFLIVRVFVSMPEPASAESYYEGANRAYRFSMSRLHKQVSGSNG
jgi:hypothetical protein